MGKENFKILIRNLRTKKNEKLKIQTTASSIKFDKVSKSVRISPNLNLITANDNSVGKSTLLKLIFWGLGCEPELDTTWNSQER